MTKIEAQTEKVNIVGENIRTGILALISGLCIYAGYTEVGVFLSGATAFKAGSNLLSAWKREEAEFWQGRDLQP